MERIFEVARDFKKAEIEVKGVADIKKEAREHAKLIARKFNKKIEVFSHTFDMYKKAFEESKEGKVIIYDSSPSQLHFSHIYKSIMHDFYHLSEKPPYFSEREKEVLDKIDKSHLWSCDLIEFENPAVLTAIDYVKKYNLKICEMKAFRFNSIGIKKLLDPLHRIGVEGGCLFDKAVHEAYLAKFAEICGNNYKKWKINSANGEYVHASLKSKKFLSIFGKEQEEISKDTALAQAEIKGKIDKISFEISCGWFGIPENVKNFLKKNFGNIASQVIVSNEELRVFVLRTKKEKEIVGDMKNFQVFVKENNKIHKIPLLVLEKDQIYRIFKKFVEHSLGIAEFPVKKSYIDFIMEVIFNAREKIFESFVQTGKVS